MFPISCRSCTFYFVSWWWTQFLNAFPPPQDSWFVSQQYLHKRISCHQRCGWGNCNILGRKVRAEGRNPDVLGLEKCEWWERHWQIDSRNNRRREIRKGSYWHEIVTNIVMWKGHCCYGWLNKRHSFDSAANLLPWSRHLSLIFSCLTTAESRKATAKVRQQPGRELPSPLLHNTGKGQITKAGPHSEILKP